MRALLVQNGRLFDPARGVDEIGDILVVDGTIRATGRGLGAPDSAEVLDVAGSMVVPGLIDAHVHLFGAIGFASADSVGVQAGVTTLCDAGGAGLDTMGEFLHQVVGRERTEVYSWLYLGPDGLAVSFLEGQHAPEVRDVVPRLDLAGHLDLAEQHHELIAGIKVPAFAGLGARGPMTVAKGLAVMMELPLYVHVGDLQAGPGGLDDSVEPSLEVLGEGDVITHCYTPNPGGLFDRELRLRPSIRRALDRGVRLDLGVGAFNLDFDVAAAGIAQGIVPATLSSDLQQANVTGPVHSLAHVMSMFLHLGLSLADVVVATTAASARLLRQQQRLGTLRPGSCGDLTVLDVLDETVELQDTNGGRRVGNRRVVPRLAVKAGVVVEVDHDVASELSNWSIWRMFADDHVPDAAASLDEVQLAFLAALHQGVVASPGWDVPTLRSLIDAAVAASALPLDRVGTTVLSVFLDRVFPQSPSHFLAGLDRELVVDRLAAVAELDRPAPLASSGTEQGGDPQPTV